MASAVDVMLVIVMCCVARRAGGESLARPALSNSPVVGHASYDA